MVEKAYGRPSAGSPPPRVNPVPTYPLQIPCTATVVPQLAGASNPDGSNIYLCGGRITNDRDLRHGEKCNKYLGAWQPPAGQLGADHGTFKVRCRTCKTMNHLPLKMDFGD